MSRIVDRKAWQDGRVMYAHLTRRTLLTGMAGAFGTLALARAALGQSKPRVINYGHTGGVHEMAQYAVPDYLPDAYKVEWVDFGIIGVGRLAAMLRGLCDVMTTANTYAVSARAEGAAVTGIAGMAGRGQALVVREDRGISRLEDLRGKRIATARYSSSHVMLMVILRAVGLDPEKDIEFVDIGQPAGFNVLLEKGDVDAGLLWEPNVSIVAMKDGFKKLELDRFFKLTWPTHSGTYVLQKTIDEEPELVADLVRASLKATELLKGDHEKWLEFAQRYTTQPRDVLIQATANSDLRNDFDLTMLYRAAETMYDLGIVKSNVADQMERAFDYSFLSQATGKTREQLGFVSYADFKAGKKSSI